jgi:hypothetical protein
MKNFVEKIENTDINKYVDLYHEDDESLIMGYIFHLFENDVPHGVFSYPKDTTIQEVKVIINRFLELED